MNSFSIYKLVGFILVPFLILFVVWGSLGEDMDVFFIHFINSLLSAILITLIITTLCSWWFCLARSARLNVPIVLTIISVLLTVFMQKVMSFESIQPNGLYTPLAIILSNSLKLLTISLSFGFIILIGLLILKDSREEEE
ncbi:MAG: hypothetical protein VYE59_03290 [Candidatus Thermoplasmatota archaeon]|nr:hypothetical protein [Candidatus Thermoplasmatota archaeon]MED5485621.1 hypothetical protein [Candidatus Thermoplasmatota archaeon]MEE3134378.1 hypothetical protein [Candidatus Thermoplasmatota archaeon]